ncbi:MAG: response regulator [Deltaproteobacteria bacterium]|nr:response regulator [Deltaproteobacteria bacterium]MBW1984096.1 response regulator [Deltaproteobacteria bacterium]MBW2179582.1 response regulator [Deltaproteobacteria bacterium]
MIKSVLIVDDDQEMLLALKDGLEKYYETFSLLLAEDGMKAIDILNSKTISLVVTDLKMPGTDGFALLAHVMENYPDIPVVVITGYSTAEMERLAKEGGAVGYIAKPFMIETLARKILITLRKESEGGTLHSVSSGIFLQLMEIEQKTCTIRLSGEDSEKNGVLFFRDGELLDARVDDLQGKPAAYEIFSWDEVTLSIQNECPPMENKIQSDLQPIILEAMRLRDESDSKDAEDVKISLEGAKEERPKEKDFIDDIKKKLETNLGNRSGMEDLYFDTKWNRFMDQMAKAGLMFNLGKLKISYIDSGEDKDFVLIPGKETTVLKINQKAPRDRILQLLSD